MPACASTPWLWRRLATRPPRRTSRPRPSAPTATRRCGCMRTRSSPTRWCTWRSRRAAVRGAMRSLVQGSKRAGATTELPPRGATTAPATTARSPSPPNGINAKPGGGSSRAARRCGGGASDLSHRSQPYAPAVRGGSLRRPVHLARPVQGDERHDTLDRERGTGTVDVLIDVTSIDLGHDQRDQVVVAAKIGEWNG